MESIDVAIKISHNRLINHDLIILLSFLFKENVFFSFIN